MNDLAVRIEQLELFGGLDVRWSAGAAYGLTGASGCGKSTLLRLIAGLLPVDANPLTISRGTVTVDGISPVAFRRSGNLGFMFQDPRLLPHWTAGENVALACAGDQLQRHEALHFLDIVGLAEKANKRPHEMSGGERQRVALARSFASKPRLLLMDEPFSSLDASNRASLYDYVGLLIEATRPTVIIVSHDIRELLRLTSQVTVLNRHGGLAAQMAAHDVDRQRGAALERSPLEIAVIQAMARA